jgi:hypothetical protein
MRNTDRCDPWVERHLWWLLPLGGLVLVWGLGWLPRIL